MHNCQTEKIAASTARGNAADDIKSASGEIYVELKRILNMTKCGNTKDAFFRDTLAPLITEDTSYTRSWNEKYLVNMDTNIGAKERVTAKQADRTF